MSEASPITTVHDGFEYNRYSVARRSLAFLSPSRVRIIEPTRSIRPFTRRDGSPEHNQKGAFATPMRAASAYTFSRAF